MSTRAAIARPAGDGFEGRYHHWDGYPSGLGATLYALRRDTFGGDTDAMMAVLIDAHPAGWSTINGKDMTLPPRYLDYGEGLTCSVCNRDTRAHLCQTYGPDGHGQGKYPCGNGYAEHRGHLFAADPVQEAAIDAIPQCYCHGSRHESEQTVTDKDAAGSGCEYAYVLHGSTMTVLSSYTPAGRKMVGAFGSGDPDSTWTIIASVNLDGAEPNWETMA